MHSARFENFVPRRWDDYAVVVITKENGETIRVTFKNKDVSISPTGEVSILPSAEPVEVWNVRHTTTPPVHVPEEVFARAAAKESCGPMYYAKPEGAVLN